MNNLIELLYFKILGNIITEKPSWSSPPWLEEKEKRSTEKALLFKKTQEGYIHKKAKSVVNFYRPQLT